MKINEQETNADGNLDNSNSTPPDTSKIEKSSEAEHVEKSSLSEIQNSADAEKPKLDSVKTTNLNSINSFKKMTAKDLNNVIQMLPDLLKEPVTAFSFSSERIIMTYGAITAAGALLPKVFGKYKDRKVHPALFLGIIAPPASNKGVISYIRTLVLKVHKHYRQQAENARKAFKIQAAKHDAAVKAGTLSVEPKNPPYHSPVIAGHITAAKLIQQLHDNTGVPSLIVEDEVDSVASAMSGDHGQQMSKIFRSIFEHGTISQQLKGGNQHYEIDNPFMAMILAGTFDQLKKLIGHIENGLMSRFMLLSINDGSTWQSVAPCKGCTPREVLMEQFSESYFEFWKFFENLDLEIDLSKSQWETIDQIGSHELSTQYNLHNEQMSGSVKRTFNMTFRICQILTAIRQWEKGNEDAYAICSQQDFEIALKLTGHFYYCGIEFFNLLPGGGTTRTAKAREALLNSLPAKFTRAEAQLLAASQKITVRTADRFLKNFVDGKFLEKTSSGHYIKVPMANVAKPQTDEDVDW